MVYNREPKKIDDENEEATGIPWKLFSGFTKSINKCPSSIMNGL